MGVSPMYAGQTLQTWQPTLTQDGGAAVNLTGATLSLTIRNAVTLVDRVGTGIWTIVNATSGIANYAWSAADVATSGSYLLYVTATYSGGVMIFDPIPWTLNPM